ncbi:hypothetical protein CIPAW_13G071000 [Carya illinoinensis]|uniref:Uncharacterized protein n=1 Tax=Carya illinoinensis TaxID=32201 RepID=A0A8T1NPQ6_CARIL|nr:hypothetical protein CIPAW_13G071000 [Carya illinoinensis]
MVYLQYPSQIVNRMITRFSSAIQRICIIMIRRLHWQYWKQPILHNQSITIVKVPTSRSKVVPHYSSTRLMIQIEEYDVLLVMG